MNPDQERKNYALIAAGCDQPEPIEKLSFLFEKLPELSFFINSAHIYNSLINSNGFHESTITYLFGAGAQMTRHGPTVKLIEDPDLTQRVIRIFRALYNNLRNGTLSSLLHLGVSGPLIDKIKGANTVQNIEDNLLEIFKKARDQDEIYIYLLGHGMGPDGILVWPSDESHPVFSPADLSRILTNLKSDVYVTLYVWSCHGGVWNELADQHKNLRVLTVTEKWATHTGSMYDLDSYIAEHGEWLSSQVESMSLIERHARGSYQCKKPDTATGTDSFTLFLNQTLQSLIPDTDETPPLPVSSQLSYISMMIKYLTSCLIALSPWTSPAPWTSPTRRELSAREQDLKKVRSLETMMMDTLPFKPEGVNNLVNNKEHLVVILYKLSEMHTRVEKLGSSSYALLNKKVYLFMLGVALGMIDPTSLIEFQRRANSLLDLDTTRHDAALLQDEAEREPLLQRVLTVLYSDRCHAQQVIAQTSEELNHESSQRRKLYLYNE